MTVLLRHGETSLCPVRAVERWRAAAGINEGAAFRRIWTRPPVGGCVEFRAPSSHLVGDRGTDFRSVTYTIPASAKADGLGPKRSAGIASSEAR